MYIYIHSFIDYIRVRVHTDTYIGSHARTCSRKLEKKREHKAGKKGGGEHVKKERTHTRSTHFITILVGSTSINSVISITSRRKCDSQKGNEERENERAKGEREREEGRERARDRANERERKNVCM